jgi:hypothetical protein
MDQKTPRRGSALFFNKKKSIRHVPAADVNDG